MRSFLFFILLGCSSSRKGFQVTPANIEEGRKFAISTDGQAAPIIARQIVAAGGNIADAFVAASFAISVERPQSTGIGGGGFALIYDTKSDHTYAYDFREQSPASLARLGLKNMPSYSPHLVGVPGLIAGLAAIHKKWGRLPWRDLVLPAAELADRGFPADQLLLEAIQAYSAKIKQNPSLKEIFFPNGNNLQLGQPVPQKHLARVLTQIAGQGAQAFYQGDVARKIVSFVRSKGGVLGLADFKHYQVNEPKALEWTQPPYKFAGFPLPSFGGEATQLIQQNALLHTKETEVELAQNWVKVLQSVFKLREEKFERSSQKMQTSHLSLIDGEGNAISSTQTINSPFGSGLVVPELGFILNDEMDDYFLGDTKAQNSPQKMGRPLSSMSPTLVFRQVTSGLRKPLLAIGSQGGRRLLSCVNWVLVNYLWQGKTLEDSITSSRIHLAYPKKSLIVDEGTPPEWLKSFPDYEIKAPSVNCRTQTVLRESDGLLRAITDPRSTGRPAAW